MSHDISPVNPLKLYVGRPVLEAVLEDTVANMEHNLVVTPFSAEERKEVRRQLQRRQEFLEWVRGQKDDNIYVALYPDEDVPTFMGELH